MLRRQRRQAKRPPQVHPLREHAAIGVAVLRYTSLLGAQRACRRSEAHHRLVTASVGLSTRHSGEALLKSMVIGAVIGIVSGIVMGNFLAKLSRAKEVA